MTLAACVPTRAPVAAIDVFVAPDTATADAGTKDTAADIADAATADTLVQDAAADVAAADVAGDVTAADVANDVTAADMGAEVAPGNPLSCLGYCGKEAPGGCFCDDLCLDNKDCCADYASVCTGK
jgi:hypothetical protein